MKSCPVEWYHPLPVIRVAKRLSVDAQGQMGKGTGAALEKQFYVTSDEKCSIPFFSRFLSFFIQVTPSAVASAAGEGIVQRVLTEPRGALGKVLLASLDGTGIRVVSSFLDISGLCEAGSKGSGGGRVRVGGEGSCSVLGFQGGPRAFREIRGRGSQPWHKGCLRHNLHPSPLKLSP